VTENCNVIIKPEMGKVCRTNGKDDMSAKLWSESMKGRVLRPEVDRMLLTCIWPATVNLWAPKKLLNYSGQINDCQRTRWFPVSVESHIQYIVVEINLKGPSQRAVC
jgi:hypothetical protein